MPELNLRETQRRYPATAGYRYRDPRYLTPAQIAGLDARFPRRPQGDPPAPQAVWGAASREARLAKSRENRWRFAKARERGMSVADAAKAMGVSRNTGNRWERRRLAEVSAGDHQG